MSIAALTNIEKTFGKRVIFNQLSFNLEKGERIGFIGPNGAGKTTLFKVLTGELVPDMGTVAIAKSTKVGMLSQDPHFDDANTVMDEAETAFAQLHVLSHEMRELEHEMAEHHDEALEKILEKYQNVQHEFDLAGGYAWRHRLEATLLGVGLVESTWEQKVTTLSGGQRSRLALAKLLIAEPDVLLLDEPTNHLDLAAIEWLEKYLLDFNGATIIISHDRYLLDRLATRIVWLTRQQLNSYHGNYTAFVAQREIEELSQKRQFEEQQADIEKQKEFIRRFGAGQRSKEAKGREKRLNRLLASDEVVQSVEVTKHIHLSINTDLRAGDQVLQVRELSKGFDKIKLWDDIGFHVKRGERIGIIGPNGSGKTTLLETLLGHCDADNGDIRWGASLKIGYYDQKLDDFDPENTVAEEIRGDREGVKDQDLRNVMALMLFRGDDPEKQIKLLSGGERARVALCQLLIDKPNVLLLDEPTNHLDIDSAGALEGALNGFDGTILFVSHDRYFLDRVAQRLLVLTPPGITDFEGNYSGWMAKLASIAKAESERKAEAERAKKQPKNAPKQAQKPKKKANADNPYMRPFGRLTQPALEQEITDTEVALAECQSQFGSIKPGKDRDRGQKLQADYDALAKKLKQLEAEYYERGEEE